MAKIFLPFTVVILLLAACSNAFKKDTTVIDVIAEPLYIGGVFTAYALNNTVGRLIPESKPKCLKEFRASAATLNNTAFVLSAPVKCNKVNQIDVDSDSIFVLKNTQLIDSSNATVIGKLYKCNRNLTDSKQSQCRYFSDFSFVNNQQTFDIVSTNQSFKILEDTCTSKWPQKILHATNNKKDDITCNMRLIKTFPVKDIF